MLPTPGENIQHGSANEKNAVTSGKITILIFLKIFIKFYCSAFL